MCGQEEPCSSGELCGSFRQWAGLLGSGAGADGPRAIGCYATSRIRGVQQQAGTVMPVHVPGQSGHGAQPSLDSRRNMVLLKKNMVVSV